MTHLFVRLYLIAFLPIVLPLVLTGWRRRQITIRHPSLLPHQQMRRRAVALVVAAQIALASMIGNSFVAAMGPQEPATIVQHIVKRRNVCMEGDQSGSMYSILKEGLKELADDEAKTKNDPTAKLVTNGGSDKIVVASGEGKPEDFSGQMTRLQGMFLTMRFLIHHRMTDNPDETDRFCLMKFDTDTYMVAPLTNDKRVILRRTLQLTENAGGGTNFFGPTGDSVGIGPLQKALDYFGRYTDANATNVVIIITDGYDSGDPKRIEQLLALYKAAHLRLYVIGLGDGWKEGNDLALQRFADSIHAQDNNNGIVFRAQNPKEMEAAMETIDRLEAAQEVIQSVQTYQECPLPFIIAAILSGVIYLGLVLVLRRIP